MLTNFCFDYTLFSFFFLWFYVTFFTLKLYEQDKNIIEGWRQTSIPWAEFEPTIPAAKIHSPDRTFTVICWALRCRSVPSIQSTAVFVRQCSDSGVRWRWWSCRWRTLNFGHQHAYCSSRWWYMSMENYGGMISTGENFWFVHQASLATLQT
jgi:hypothetical protein